jgi:hypothetical protein
MTGIIVWGLSEIINYHTIKITTNNILSYTKREYGGVIIPPPKSFMNSFLEVLKYTGQIFAGISTIASIGKSLAKVFKKNK